MVATVPLASVSLPAPDVSYSNHARTYRRGAPPDRVTFTITATELRAGDVLRIVLGPARAVNLGEIVVPPAADDASPASISVIVDGARLAHLGDGRYPVQALLFHGDETASPRGRSLPAAVVVEP